MRKLFNKKFLIPIFSCFCFLVPVLALATDCPPGASCISNPIGVSTIDGLITLCIDILFTISLLAAPIPILLAGFYYLTAGDKVEQTKKANKMILYTVIGLVIIICAKGIITLLNQVLGVK